jgi:superfamily II DNA or RNA helicase
MMMGVIREYLLMGSYPILVLCSRREVGVKIKETLITQLGLNPEGVGLVFSGAPKHTKKLLDVTISTYLSAASFLTKGVKLVIVDEAHHSRAENLFKLIQRFKASGSIVVGYTATPSRHDSKSLLKVFDSEAILSPKKFEDYEGVTLCDFEVKAFPVLSLVDVAKKASKFRKNSEYFTSNLILNHIATIVKAHFDSGEVTRAILFAIDINHARLLQVVMQSKGLRVGLLASTLSKQQRAETFKSFAKGELDIVCNVRILEDGVDFPECDSIIICATFGSLNQYMQACGRSLRYQPGKVAKILDFSGASLQHGTPRIERIPKFNSESRPKSRKCKSCEIRTDLPLKYQQITQFELGKTVFLKWWECPHCGHKHWVEEKPKGNHRALISETPSLMPVTLDVQTQQVLAIAMDGTLSIPDRIENLQILRDSSEEPFSPVSLYLGLRMISPLVSDSIARQVSNYRGASLEELMKEVGG